MNPQLSDPRWSEAQRQFLAALEAAGANKAEHAVPIDRATPLPARDLQLLVDSGVVREASANGYYLYPRQAVATSVGSAALQFVATAHQLSTRGRLVRAIIFWFIVILIPIILLRLTGSK